MINNYGEAEITEVGNADDVIRGDVKGEILDDSPFQEYRTPVQQDDE